MHTNNKQEILRGSVLLASKMLMQKKWGSGDGGLLWKSMGKECSTVKNA